MKWNIIGMRKIISDYKNCKRSNNKIKDLLIDDKISKRELYYILKIRYPRLMNVK